MTSITLSQLNAVFANLAQSPDNSPREGWLRPGNYTINGPETWARISWFPTGLTNVRFYLKFTAIPPLLVGVALDVSVPTDAAPTFLERKAMIDNAIAERFTIAEGVEILHFSHLPRPGDFLENAVVLQARGNMKFAVYRDGSQNGLVIMMSNVESLRDEDFRLKIGDPCEGQRFLKDDI